MRDKGLTMASLRRATRLKRRTHRFYVAGKFSHRQSGTFTALAVAAADDEIRGFSHPGFFSAREIHPFTRSPRERAHAHLHRVHGQPDGVIND